MNAPLIEVDTLSYGTPEGRILQENLSFSLQPGQLALITGSNGCGKSTLLKALLGRFVSYSGTIRFAVPLENIEYIPQLENTEVHFPLTLADVLTVSVGAKLDWGEIRKCGLLTRQLLSMGWNTASGGERKRALLTRALLKSPQILVLDEPMNHLDEESRCVMVHVMSRFLQSKENRRGIVLVCHQGLPPSEVKHFDIVPLDLNLRKGLSA